MSQSQVPLRWSVATVLLVAAATYANSLVNGFALDDEPIIATGTRVHQLADQATIWLTPYWSEHGGRAGLYRPLAIFTYALQWAAGNGAPWLFHAVSILLHAGVCMLVLLLLRRMLGAAPALAGALIFAVHPLHTEAVANIVGQAELIAAACTVGACVLHVARPAARVEAWRAAVMLLLFAAALLAKESAIVLPALLVTLDLGTRRAQAERNAATYARAVVPLLALLALAAFLWLALRARVLGSWAGTEAAPYLPFLQDSPGQRVLTALRVWPEYLRLLFWPVDLSADYSPAVIVPPENVTASVIAGAVLLLATAVTALLLPWRPRLVAAAWFLIAVLPVSNLIVPIGVILAERTLYLPSLAVAILAAQLVANAPVSTSPAMRRALAAGAVVLLVLAGVRSGARNPAWRDTSAYWQALIRDHPESYRAQRGAGELMFARGDLALARRYLELAWDTWPYDADLAGGLGALYLRLGEPGLAIERIERARALGDRSTQARQNLALAYAAAGRHAESAAAWHAVAMANPLGWHPWLQLARARIRAGDVNGGLAAADTAYGLAPDDASRAATDSVRALIPATRTSLVVRTHGNPGR